MKPKTIKLLEEKVENLCDLQLGKYFLDKTPKVQSIKDKFDKLEFIKIWNWDFSGGPVVKDLPSNAGDTGLIPGWGIKIPHAAGQQSLRTLKPAHRNEEPMSRNERSCMPQLRPKAAK